MSGLSVQADTIGSSASLVCNIGPHQRWSLPDVGLVWRHRELLSVLTWRDIKIRYKQTVLGIVWAILQPTSTMIVFSIFFGRLANINSDGIPYPIFAFAALIPWMFFSNSLTSASNSLLGNSSLITKVYFPRLVIPIASVLSNLVDFALSFVALLGLMLCYGMTPSWSVFLLVIPTLLALVTALGAGFWLSALNLQFRDVRFALPFCLQIWMFLSPIAYSSSLVEGRWRILYGLNPMTGVIECFRWALCNTEANTPPLMIGVSAVMSLIMLVTGAIYFQRMEQNFADLV
ncbi:MAG: phosphate ABC transporter permease [Pirellula sp.]|nr:phosphate ABC transporter permease [Pirellula sp.]